MGAFKKTGGFGGHDSRGGDRGGFPGGDDRPRFANKGFGGKSFGNKFGGGREDRGPVELYTATCAECGKQCEVPFRPNGQKPVFCKECFGSKRGAPVGEFRGPAPERTFPKRDFAPAPVPTYTPKALPDPRIDLLQRQLDSAHTKLDTLTSMIAALMPDKPTKKAAKAKK